MPIKKWLKPYEKRTDDNREVRTRVSIVEEIATLTAPVWDWKKYKKKMTIEEACSHVGISWMTFRNWRQEDERIKRLWNETVASRKEFIHSTMENAALNNVMEWVTWAVKLRPLDKINVSLRYLEKTSPEFNPAMKLDIESNNTSTISIMSTEEMEQRILELSSALWIINNKQNEWTNDTTPLHAINNEE